MRLTLIARVDRPERLANLAAIPGNAALELERAFGRVIDNDIAGDMFQCALLADMGGPCPDQDAESDRRTKQSLSLVIDHFH
jgi:hypothetical protein